MREQYISLCSNNDVILRARGGVKKVRKTACILNQCPLSSQHSLMATTVKMTILNNLQRKLSQHCTLLVSDIQTLYQETVGQISSGIERIRVGSFAFSFN